MPSSISMYVTPKDEEKTAAIFDRFTTMSAELRSLCSSISVNSNSWIEDEDLKTDAEGELYHDEQTLVKVAAGIRQALPNCPYNTVQNIINGIMNEGVLFREIQRR